MLRERIDGSDLGFPAETVPYDQPLRVRGVTSNNFFTLYDLAMVGITSHSKVPLRLVTLAGFLLSALSLLVALVYFAYKLIFWSRFPAGIAPAVIGIFLLCSFQLFCMGLLGEYVALIHTRVMKSPSSSKSSGSTSTETALPQHSDLAAPGEGTSKRREDLALPSHARHEYRPQPAAKCLRGEDGPSGEYLSMQSRVAVDERRDSSVRESGVGQ